jgi:hypothetical protein
MPVAMAQADSLSATLNPDQTLNLQLQAATNKDYAIQTNGLLVNPQGWSNLLNVATGDTGSVGTNTSVLAAGQMFFRSASLPPLSATTTQASGSGNTAFTITLTGNDPIYTNSTLTAVITQLPAHGQLLQTDQSPIAVVPATVSSPSNQVIFVPQTNVVATNYDTFSYLVKRVANGVTSLSQPVAVSVIFTPLPPIVPNLRLEVTENQPLLFTIGSYDPSPPPGAEPLTNIIVSPCVVGRLYQVQSDNVTQGAVILGTDVIVSNANQWLMYIPPSYQSGYAYEDFFCRAQNSYGQFSSAMDVVIDIAHVNHAPVAYNESVLEKNDDDGVEFNVDASDIDGDSLSVYFTQLPTNGTLSYGNDRIPVVPGVGYANDFFYVPTSDLSNCLDIYSKVGMNFDHFVFYAEDGGGLTSGLGTNTINIVYVNTPPAPSGPTNYTSYVNSSGDESETSPAAEQITLTATDVDGDLPYFTLDTLPQHGTLYFENVNINQSVQNGDFSLPADLTTSQAGQPVLLTYVPDPGFNNGQGLDSFSYQVRDDKDQNPCTFTVTLNVNGPTIDQIPTITVVVDSNGNYVTNGLITGFTVYADQIETSLNQIISYSFMQVNTNTASATAAGGDIRVVGSPRGVQSLAYSDGGITFNAVVPAINKDLSSPAFGYEASSTNGANYLQFIITPKNGEGPPVTNYFPVAYVTQTN